MSTKLKTSTFTLPQRMKSHIKSFLLMWLPYYEQKAVNGIIFVGGHLF